MFYTYLCSVHMKCLYFFTIYRATGALSFYIVNSNNPAKNDNMNVIVSEMTFGYYASSLPYSRLQLCWSLNSVIQMLMLFFYVCNIKSTEVVKIIKICKTSKPETMKVHATTQLILANINCNLNGLLARIFHF